MLIGAGLIGSAFAYSLPEEPFTRWPWIVQFTDIMAGLVPAIDRLTEVSKFPQVTRLFMSLQWAVWMPICFVVMTKFSHPSEKSVILAMRLAQARWWYSFFIPPSMAVMGWFFVVLPWVDNGPSITPFNHIIVWMSQDRFWLGMFGSLFVTMAIFAVIGILRSYTVIRMAYLVRASSPLSWKNSR